MSIQQKPSLLTPHQLRQDNDGHWYLVAEKNLVRFEEALELGAADDYEVFSKIPKIQIDSPERLRILAWEEI